jgi:DNA-binding CsgD family transcriptional regulator
MLAARFAELTPRERELEVVSGLDNAQTAEQFFLSPFTVGPTPSGR